MTSIQKIITCAILALLAISSPIISGNLYLLLGGGWTVGISGVLLSLFLFFGSCALIYYIVEIINTKLKTPLDVEDGQESSQQIPPQVSSTRGSEV